MQEGKMPKVSVCVVTYNQEKYIRQCLLSIVEQKTNFAFEVIVGDDCSTDGTRAIAEEFAERYPGLIKPIFHNENIGAIKNYFSVHDAALGEYIAHVDGDDFMLPGKLNIQAGELDSNPECSICVHVMKQFDQQNKSYRKFWPRTIPRKSNIDFLLINLPFFNHSSKMYRSECRNDFDSRDDEIIDCYLHVHHALKGDILYLNDVLGVYRMNVGISTVNSCMNSKYYVPNPKMLVSVLKSIEYARRSGVDEDLINKAKAMAYFKASYRHLIANDFQEFKELINISYATAKVNNTQLLFKSLSGVPLVLFLLVRLRARLMEII